MYRETPELPCTGTMTCGPDNTPVPVEGTVQAGCEFINMTCHMDVARGEERAISGMRELSVRLTGILTLACLDVVTLKLQAGDRSCEGDFLIVTIKDDGSAHLRSCGVQKLTGPWPRWMNEEVQVITARNGWRVWEEVQA